MTEKEKMLSGKLYDPTDKELYSKSTRAHDLCAKYNRTLQTQSKKRAKILSKLLPHAGANCHIQGPVYFDYGEFTKIGKNFYANFNLTILDVCPVTIGDGVLIGPNVSILTPKHPLWAEDRRRFYKDGVLTDQEYGAPIVIGDDVWIAGGVTVCAGAKIGSGCVIGAGSVVTGEIPPYTLAYGVPCRPARKITAEDAVELKKELF